MADQALTQEQLDTMGIKAEQVAEYRALERTALEAVREHEDSQRELSEAQEIADEQEEAAGWAIADRDKWLANWRKEAGQ